MNLNECLFCLGDLINNFDELDQLYEIDKDAIKFAYMRLKAVKKEGVEIGKQIGMDKRENS